MKKNKKIIISFVFCILLAASVSIFADKSEVQAAGSYSIQINKGTNVVTVYNSSGRAERAFVCSTGTATPIGTFSTKQKLRWHVLDGPSYGQYCTRITGSILFHSVWYYRNGDYASQSYREYNKLGTTASHGCVRLTVADSKWIYDNCPLGTTVRIIYGSSANDPLGKPAAIKVPNVKEGWDPTDPDPRNPYSSYRPSIDISGANKTVSYGTKFNPFSGITAKDSLGNDISGWLRYSGEVNTKKIGKYKVTYYITDALGRSDSKSVVYKVRDTKKATIKGVKKSLKKEYNSVIKLKKNVRAYNATGKNLTKKIAIKIVYPGGKKEKTYKKSELRLSKLGTYKINYYVVNPNNKLKTKVTCKVKVQDKKKPKFAGIPSQKTVEYNSVQNLKSKVTAKLVSGKNMTSKIVIKAKGPGQKKYTDLTKNKSTKYKKYKFSKVGTYSIEYSVANPYNKKAVAKKVMKVIVKDTKKPNLKGVAGQKTLEYNTILNLKSGVTAKLVSGTDVSSRIVIKVKEPGAAGFRTLSKAQYEKYQFNKTGSVVVEYSVSNPNNGKNISKATMNVTVRDTQAPEIKGVGNKQVEIEGKLNLRTGVTANLKSGTDLTSNIKITVTTPENVTTEFTGSEYVFAKEGTYTVKYHVVNPSNSKAADQKTMTVTVTDNRELKLEISETKVHEVQVDEVYHVLDGVTASLGQTPITDIKVEITGTDSLGQEITAPKMDQNGNVTFTTAGTYKITYTVKHLTKDIVKTEIFELTVKEKIGKDASQVQVPDPGADIDSSSNLNQDLNPDQPASVDQNDLNQESLELQSEDPTEKMELEDFSNEA
ncbi:MAG: DUF5011 domain-containing protein [Lachnospiraceae bacterium]|nr:DUF5011 domain-containing protein [Lachnospiraceae bacterium]